MYALLNCLICFWYGSPFVSPGVILVATVNSIGAFFQSIYLSIFILYAERAIKVTVLTPITYLNFSIAVSESLNEFYNSVINHHSLLLQLRMTGLLLAAFALFAIIVFVSMRMFDVDERQIFVGYLSVVSLISMFASPLFIIVSSSSVT